MAELFIESVPSGAEVKIDSVIVGKTPMTYTIGGSVDLEAFRAECLTGGSVTCSWDVLKTRLEDKTVSKVWWDLTRNERYSVAKHATTNTFPRGIIYKRKGNPNCSGGVGEWGRAMCVPNTMIRCLKIFKNPSPSESDADQCYWKDHSGNEHCYHQDNTYDLPCHTVSCINHDRAVYHSLAAIQIDADTDLLNSWCIFQYDDFNIKPGDWQLPTGSRVSIYAPDILKCGSSYGTLLHRSVI